MQHGVSTGSGVVLAFSKKREHEGEALASALRDEGFAVDSRAVGTEFVERMTSLNADLLLLDCCAAGRDVESLRAVLSAEDADTGIIVLCENVEPLARARLLYAGADDVVPKPFDLQELIARAEAVRRRVRRTARTLRAGRITVVEGDRVAYVDDARVPLTDREWSLLRLLVRRVNRTVSRTEVIANVWCTETSLASNVLNVHIAHLRRKLGEAGQNLRAVRGVGYRLEVGGAFSDGLSAPT
jgi:DNA-binding response OmpR family regulator